MATFPRARVRVNVATRRPLFSRIPAKSNAGVVDLAYADKTQLCWRKSFKDDRNRRPRPSLQRLVESHFSRFCRCVVRNSPVVDSPPLNGRC